MYGERSFFCSRCKKDSLEGVPCPSSEKGEPCVDSEMEAIKKANLKRTSKKS